MVRVCAVSVFNCPWKSIALRHDQMWTQANGGRSPTCCRKLYLWYVFSTRSSPSLFATSRAFPSSPFLFFLHHSLARVASFFRRITSAEYLIRCASGRRGRSKQHCETRAKLLFPSELVTKLLAWWLKKAISWLEWVMMLRSLQEHWTLD